MVMDPTQLSTVPKIGEIFVEAGIVRPHVISESLALAKRAKMPVGRVLVMSGYVRERDVESALKTQQLVREGRATREAACRIVRIAHTQKMSVEDAESQDLCERAFRMPFSQVGRMLLAAKIVSEKFLLVATRQSCELRSPLGRFLVKQGAISEDILIAVINVMILVRDKKISRLEAVRILRETHQEKRSDIRESLKRHALDNLIEQNAPRLCDLFVSSGVITRQEMGWALEMALETNRRIGQVLLDAGFINETLLESALQLQRMVSERTLKSARASELLSLCDALRASLESLLAEFDRLNEVVEFLRRGKIFDERVIREVAAQTPDFYVNPGAALLRHQIVNPEMLDRAYACLGYFRAAKLTEKQAIDTFKISSQRHIPPSEALRYLNWDVHNLHGEHELLGKTA